MKTEVYDYIVVGSGLAGLSFALKASNYGKVLILTKSVSIAGSTGRAQGGIASVMSPQDSLEKHVSDTLRAGMGLCREDRVKILVSEGPEAIHQLVHWGVQFSRNPDESHAYDLVKEGGHSEFRILHSEDFTGKEIHRALLEAVTQDANITIKENRMAIDLITPKHLKKKGALGMGCFGLYALDVHQEKVEMLIGSATVLCTGGIGQLYTHTTNDPVSTGDGIAMAYRAGVPVEDMEFMQFHPTSLYDPGQPTFLISEVLRGHGGVLRNAKGKPIMEGIHPDLDLAPRDVVARAIDVEMKQSGAPSVYLDMTAFPVSELKTKFPNIYQHCVHRGIDMATQYIPVVPAAHFLCGGIQVDEDSQTALPGLYACGETASTGVHGANRLASNSLLEAVVFSNRALKHLVAHQPPRPDPEAFLAWDETKVKPAKEFSVYTSALETLRSTMWNYVGIVRNDLRLSRALDFVDLIHNQVLADYGSFTIEPRLIELRNLALNAELIIKSAMLRKESRGLHYNLDYPDLLPEAQHAIMRKN